MDFNQRQLFILIIVFFLTTKVNSQSRWTCAYYEDKDAIGNCFTETYDNGYAIVGKHGHSYVHYNWLIKTDINGQILWEKTIGDPNSYFTILHIASTEGGQLYCSGITDYYDNDMDPIILKIDSCGSKEWCKVFYTPANYDFSNFVLAMEDGGCIVILRYTGDDPTGQIDRICLAKLSSDGELLWKQCYNSADSGIINADARYLTISPDQGFLITATCDYLDPNQLHLYWAKQYYIKTDSLGNFQWETVVHSDVGGEAGGDAWSTTLSPAGTHYYSSISHYYPDHNTGALLKMDLEGNVIDIYDLIDGFENGGLAHSTFINDTVIAGSAGWGNTIEDIVNHAVLMDTLGNILDYEDLVQDIYGSILQVAQDTKLVYMYNTYENNQFDVYLRKLNYNLEDDTLYTFPFQYDTLCPYPIASDTLVQDDCGLIVGMPEPIEPDSEEPDQFLIYPNPATDHINCRLSTRLRSRQATVNCQLSILIVDIYGRKIEEIEIPEAQKEVEINISSYLQGIYIAVLRDGKRIIARKKFMVARP